MLVHCTYVQYTQAWFCIEPEYVIGGLVHTHPGLSCGRGVIAWFYMSLIHVLIVWSNAFSLSYPYSVYIISVIGKTYITSGPF